MVLFRNKPLVSILLFCGFCLADLLLFAALPRLGLSFGRRTIAPTAWIVLRLFLLISYIGVLKLANRNPAAPPPKKGAFSLFIFANFGLLVVLVYGFYIEPFRLTVTHLERQIPGMAAGESLRVVHLSDLHVERITRRERAVVETVNSLEPDLILMTGDYVNMSYMHDPQAKAEARAVVSQLEAKAGIYAVSGSIYNQDGVRELFSGMDVEVLHNELRPLAIADGAVTLVGMSFYNWYLDEDALRFLMSQTPPDSYTILLYHMPDIIEAAEDEGVDLYLAGHTHGGQIRLPFYGAFVTMSRYGKQYEMGLYQVGDTELYVSRGLGMEGGLAPRARFLCPPEIVVIDFHG